MERSYPEDIGRAVVWTKAVLVTILALLLLGAAGCDREGPEERATTFDRTTTGTMTERTATPAIRPTPRTVESETPAPEPPAPVQVTFADAEETFHAGAYREAVELFEAYVERRPENPWGFYMIGLSAWRSGDLERAETALKRALELDGTHTRARLNLARVLLEKGEATEALELATEVTTSEPELGEAWRVVGNTWSELGDTEKAADSYMKAIALDPDDAWTMNNLGLLRIRKGEHETALGPLVRATQLRPEQAVFQNNLGIALEGSGREVHAAGAFEAALEAAPEHEKASVSLERVKARIPGDAVPDPSELALLGEEFLAEVERWELAGAEEAD